MKKVSKILSLTLVLVMILSVAVMPTSAAAYVITTGLELVKVEDEDVLVYNPSTFAEETVKASSITDGDIYKLVISLSSAKPLQMINIGITYNQSKFAPCWGETGIKPSATPQYKIWGHALNDPDYIGESLSNGVNVAAKPVGQFADTSKYKADGSIFTTGPQAQYKGNGMFSASESSGYKAYDTAGAQKDTIVAGNGVGFSGDAATDGAIMFEQKLSPTTQYKLVKAFKATTLEPVWEVYFKTAEGADVSGARFAVTGLVAATYDGEADFYDKAKTSLAVYPAEMQGCELIVAPAAEPSIITPMSSQIRFKNVKTVDDFKVYNGLEDGHADKTFDVRSRATIAKEDFNAKFTDEATAKAKISEFGFIYRANTSDDPNVTDYPAFSYAEAQLAAQNKSSDSTYVKKRCTYLQRTAEGYNFTCLITPIKDTAKSRADGVTCLAYVCFDGEYIFFDKEVVVDYATLYAVNPGTTA